LTHVKLEVAVLVAILIMSFAITSSLAKGQVATTIQNASPNSATSQSDNTNLKGVLDQRYLGLLGLYSNATQVNSSINSTDNVATKGYSYQGNFTLNDKSYLVESTQFQITYENQTITTVTQKISGSENSYCASTENDTIVDNVLLSQDEWSVQTSNSSGNYQLTMNSTGTYNSETSTPINVHAELYQNLTGSIGEYTIGLSPSPSNASESTSMSQNTVASVSMPEIALTITSPDGAQSTANMIPDSADSQSAASAANFSPTDSAQGSNNPLGDFTIPVPSPGISWTLFNPLFSFQNSYMLTGFFIYWSGDASAYIGLGMFIIGLVAGALIVPTAGASAVIFAIFFDTFSAVLALSGFFTANLDGASITIMYFELEFYLVFGFLPVPYYEEMGYYSDYSTFYGSCTWTFF